MHRKTALVFCGKSQYLVRNRVCIRCQKRPILSKFVKIFVGDTNFCRGTHFSENFDKFRQKSTKFSGKFHSKMHLQSPTSQKTPHCVRGFSGKISGNFRDSPKILSKKNYLNSRGSDPPKMTPFFGSNGLLIAVGVHFLKMGRKKNVVLHRYTTTYCIWVVFLFFRLFANTY